MKWLQGWFGTASGLLGIVYVALLTLLAPASSAQYSSGASVCSTSADGSTICTGSVGYGTGAPTPAPGLNIAALVLVGLTLLFFVGVLVGTWLDLGGRRSAGRLLLLICATLLIPGPFFLAASVGGIDAAAYAYTLLFAVPAIVAGILACARRDEPRAALMQPTEQPQRAE